MTVLISPQGYIYIRHVHNNNIITRLKTILFTTHPSEMFKKWPEEPFIPQSVFLSLTTCFLVLIFSLRNSRQITMLLSNNLILFRSNHTVNIKGLY